MKREKADNGPRIRYWGHDAPLGRGRHLNQGPVLLLRTMVPEETKSCVHPQRAQLFGRGLSDKGDWPTTGEDFPIANDVCPRHNYLLSPLCTIIVARLLGDVYDVSHAEANKQQRHDP